MSLLEIVPIWIRGIPDNLKTQEMCNEAMREGPYNLQHVPDHFKTEEICNEAVDIEPLLLAYVPDRFKHGGCVTKQFSQNHAP